MLNLLDEVQKNIQDPRFLKKLGLNPDCDLHCRELANGEYNANFLLELPESETLVLRLNFGSQMHLDNQISYEYNALQLLENSGRTPKPYICDDSCEIFSQPYLVMEFLPGRPLRYGTDLEIAAEILADIHSLSFPKDHNLIVPEAPAYAIYQECEDMIDYYYNWSEAKPQVIELIQEMFVVIGALPLQEENPSYHCLVNTELNSGNFLINESPTPSYLIDWEKPLYAEPAQDLAHFLVPTTTFWKTDVILTPDQIRKFYSSYEKSVADRFALDGLPERVSLFFSTTCLRGISWCAMALREYESPSRTLRNEGTYEKIKSYLEVEFLENILENYMKKDFLR